MTWDYPWVICLQRISDYLLHRRAVESLSSLSCGVAPRTHLVIRPVEELGEPREGGPVGIGSPAAS